MNERDPSGWLGDYAPFTEHRFSSWLYLPRPARVAYRCVQVAAVSSALAVFYCIAFLGWR